MSIILENTDNAPFSIKEHKPVNLLDLEHSAYLLETDEGTILFAPHGAKGKNLSKADVLINTTTHYHLPFWLGGTVNLGFQKAELLYRNCGAKVFLSTHDEQKLGKGLVEKLAKKNYVTNADFVTYLKAGESLTI